MALIIVESPTKARTFNRILKGQDYLVFATMGHIRDLPSNKLSIDYKQDFKPSFNIIKNKTKVVAGLKKFAGKNKEIILATDPDREGESISYHVAYILGLVTEKWPEIAFKSDQVVKRIVFHEITSRALQEALKNPETLRFDLVKAQFARRILDRIVGYELSPLLWKTIGKNWLSAGRVQTVALRLIVEREKEIKNFKIEDYWQIYGMFFCVIASEAKQSLNGIASSSRRNVGTPRNDNGIKAKLIKHNGVDYVETFKLELFAGTYEYTKTTIIKDKVPEIKKELTADKYQVTDIAESVQNRYPPPPFTTSLLQQDAFHKLGFSSRMTMKLAQDLYERGLITYHRTDSFNLSTQFVFAAKKYIEETFGKNYALDKPRGYHTKSRLAQEAHEAIRPTHLDKQKNLRELTANHRRLFELIFNRAVSTQMKEATVKTFKLEILGLKNAYLFQSDIQQVLFDGFLKVLNPQFVANNQTGISVKKGDKMQLLSLQDVASQTKPPPYYNEATLIKILEEKGIGRPSTYAPIITLIQLRNYVEKEGRYFLPTQLGQAVSDYLVKSFPNIFNLEFTASMEEDLDKIANEHLDFVKLLTEFNTPFRKQLEEMKEKKEIINVEDEVKELCPKCGSNMVIRYSRFGKFLACSSYPKCKFTKPYLRVVAGKKCPRCGADVVIKFTKSKKRFYGCGNYPKCNWSSWKLGKFLAK